MISNSEIGDQYEIETIELQIIAGFKYQNNMNTVHCMYTTSCSMRGANTLINILNF